LPASKVAPPREGGITPLPSPIPIVSRDSRTGRPRVRWSYRSNASVLPNWSRAKVHIWPQQEDQCPVSQRPSRQSELLIPLDRSAREPLHVQMEMAIREAVRSQRVAAGARLPSSRTLAADLGVSRGVVVEAYDQLIAEGYLQVCVTWCSAGARSPRSLATATSTSSPRSRSTPWPTSRQASLQKLRRPLSLTCRTSPALG
jgi:hypothetical protein